MGYAIAHAALVAGHDVVLVSGPTSLVAPEGAVVVKVETAADMLEAVQQNLDGSDALIMAAAVADWRPRRVSAQKMKKADGVDSIDLERTEDVLEYIRGIKGRLIVVGFAAETENLIAEAQRKLRDKGLDLIVANDVSRADAGFDVDTNKATLLTAEGKTEDLPLMTKRELAQKIVDWVFAKQSSQ
jgi:phosphopantothenoylcysteine decarboxylase/phosphopantothenate--cysteine ligase